MGSLEPRHGDDWVPTASVLFISSAGMVCIALSVGAFVLPSPASISVHHSSGRIASL